MQFSKPAIDHFNLGEISASKGDTFRPVGGVLPRPAHACDSIQRTGTNQVTLEHLPENFHIQPFAIVDDLRLWKNKNKFEKIKNLINRCAI